MSDTPFRDPETKRSYVRFDLEKSDEELEEDVLDWLEEVFGPFSDAPQPSTTKIGEPRPRRARELGGPDGR